MHYISFDGVVYAVDHAVKGPDFIHGYDAAGNVVVAFDGISDFSLFDYDGEYVAREKSVHESCNSVKHVDGVLVRSDGGAVPIVLLRGINYGTEEEMNKVRNPIKGQIFFVLTE